jgi:hypothetical protein
LWLKPLRRISCGRSGWRLSVQAREIIETQRAEGTDANGLWVPEISRTPLDLAIRRRTCHGMIQQWR